jgi:hypothetical protein
MNNRIYLHIGFGRTSITTLQTNIYNLLIKFKNINYLYYKEVKLKGLLADCDDLDLVHKLYVSKIEKIKKLNNNDILISDEGLIAHGVFCPSSYEKNLKDILNYYGPDAKIIISIRKPSDWLSSIHSMFNNGKSVKEFFLDKETFKKFSYKDKFLIENFNYENIISKYKLAFKDVYVVKYEEIENFNFLKYIFKLDLSEIDILKKIYSSTVTSARNQFYSNSFNLLMNTINKKFKFNTSFKLKKKLTTSKSNINFDGLKIDIDELDRKYKFIKSI